jgi:hypothetical protein
MLQCSETETGHVFDPSISQISGTMQPTLFSNFVEYAGGFGGNIFKTCLILKKKQSKDKSSEILVWLQ